MIYRMVAYSRTIYLLNPPSWSRNILGNLYRLICKLCTMQCLCTIYRILKRDVKHKCVFKAKNIKILVKYFDLIYSNVKGTDSGVSGTPLNKKTKKTKTKKNKKNNRRFQIVLNLIRKASWYREKNMTQFINSILSKYYRQKQYSSLFIIV